MFTRGIHHSDLDRVDKKASKQGCKAWNVIYGISCTICKKMVYVGETSRSVKDRLKKHETGVRHGRDKPVAGHFNSNGHSVENMGVNILELVRDSSRNNRQIRELDWIDKLQTEISIGLNKKAKVGVLWHEYR